MTLEEAIKVIEGRFEIMGYCESARLEEALDLVIESLKQSQPQCEWTDENREDDWAEKCMTCKHVYKRIGDDDTLYCRRRKGCKYEQVKHRKQAGYNRLNGRKADA